MTTTTTTTTKSTMAHKANQVLHVLFITIIIIILLHDGRANSGAVLSNPFFSSSCSHLCKKNNNDCRPLTGTQKYYKSRDFLRDHKSCELNFRYQVGRILYVCCHCVFVPLTVLASRSVKSCKLAIALLVEDS